MSALPPVALPRPRSHPWRGVLLGLAIAAALLYAGAVGLVAWGQERLLFHPTVLPAEHRFQMGDGVSETWIDVPGARLNALHLRLPHPDGVVFYLHGNAGSLESWFVNVDFYRRANLDLFMVDYRGFGKSSGRIQSQAQLEDDVRAAWATVAPRYVGLKRVIFGRSLGTGLAAMLASEVQPELTVLVSPYFSMAALAGEHFPWVPGPVLRYPLRTDEWLPKVHGRIVLLHGENDTLIPVQHSERLQALVPQAQLVRVPGFGHGDIHRADLYLESVRAALTR